MLAALWSGAVGLANVAAPVLSDLARWIGRLDLGRLIADVAIPVAAIIVPTLIAIRLSRSERLTAEAARREERLSAIEDRRIERRLEAGAGVIVALAPLSTMNLHEPVWPYLWELRARIAVYRAWIVSDDRSGDWLGLRHREGMAIWSRTALLLANAGGPNQFTVEGQLELTHRAHEWAHTTTEMFTGYLSGHVPIEHLLVDGARILKAYPRDDGDAEPGQSS